MDECWTIMVTYYDDGRISESNILGAALNKESAIKFIKEQETEVFCFENDTIIEIYESQNSYTKDYYTMNHLDFPNIVISAAKTSIYKN